MVRLSQNSFFGGQLDFEMMGRQDYQRYSKGATKLRNFNIVKRGGLDKRHGFDRLLKLTGSSDARLSGVTESSVIRMIPFAYSKTQGFVLVLMSTPSDGSSKAIVLSTNPVNKFKWYTVSNLNGVYSQSELNEIDYQQCGDTMFLAHQNHPPSKVEHYIDPSNGEHGFQYEVLDFGDRSRGIPSITDSLVTRIPVIDTLDPPQYNKASLFTEKYKVSAVYNGIETLPCTEYYSENSNPYGAGSWHGTNYPMPWTESQKIRLTATVPSKTLADGTVVYPEELRFYKKAFNYYGLIGTVVPHRTRSVNQFQSPTAPSTSYTNVDGSSASRIFAGEIDYDTYYHGWNCTGYSVNSGSKLQFSFANSMPAGSYVLRLGLGSCTISRKVQNSVNTSYYDADFTYLGNRASSIAIGLKANQSDTDDVTTKTISRTSNQSKTKTRISSSNVTSNYKTFAKNVSGANYVDVEFTSTSAFKFLSITPYGGNLVVHNITFYGMVPDGTCTFDDNYITPDTSITPFEESDVPVMVGSDNYPSSVSISQQRLIWASTKADPARVFMSEIGDFYTYNAHEISKPDDCIDFKLPITRFAKINHICEMRKLLMFNSACEWLVDSASSVQGLTYETIQAYPQSYSGSSERLKPIICNNSLIFCERTGQAVRRFAYDISNDGFAGRDVSVLSASIFENNNIVDWTYQQFPYSTLWCVLKDGTAASFEFMEEQDIMAWSTHELGGNGKFVAVATSYAVSPALDLVTNASYYEYATHEEVFAVVKRAGSLWVERMRVKQKPPVGNGNSSTDTIYHSLCLDGVRVLNSKDPTPTTESGAIWIPNDTTNGASISRDAAIQKIADGVEVYEGFPFDATYISVYPVFSNSVGMGQFDIKHVQGCGFRLMCSANGKVRAVGCDSYDQIPYSYNDGTNNTPLFSGGNLTLKNNDTHIIPVKGVNNRDGRVEVCADSPYPFTMLSYEIDFELEEATQR